MDTNNDSKSYSINPCKLQCVAGYGRQIFTKLIQDAPFGAEIVETKSGNTWLETPPIPIDISSTYFCSGYIR
jgi:hypothetical protein